MRIVAVLALFPCGLLLMSFLCASDRKLCFYGWGDQEDQYYGVGNDIYDAFAQFTPQWTPDGARVVFTVDLYEAGPVREIYVAESDGTGVTRIANAGRFNPTFPILGVFRLNRQSKRDDGMIFGSFKATQSPVYPIRDAVLAVNHASCPSLSSSGPRQWGESALNTSRLPGAPSLLARSWLYPPSTWRRR